MPRAVHTLTDIGDTETHYMTVGPIPPDTLLRALIVRLNVSGAGTVTWGAALCKTDDPSAANFTAGAAIIDRTNLRAAGHPSYQQNVAIGSDNIITLPIDRRVEGGPAWIVLVLTYSVALKSLVAIATATWIDQQEEAAQFGDHRRVQIITPPPLPGTFPATGPAGIPAGPKQV